jgi:hypothetical protein
MRFTDDAARRTLARGPRARRPAGRRQLPMRFTAAGAVATAAGVLAAGFGLAAVAWGTGSASSQNGGTGWGWYKTDTHVHSVFSGDGNPDLGIIQASGLKSGYDAFFLTTIWAAASRSASRRATTSRSTTTPRAARR